MTLSEVFYEAACRMSDGDYQFTCDAVSAVGNRDAVLAYQELMANDTRLDARLNVLLYLSAVETTKAQESINWGRYEFRTFMLLMASEAVK